MLAMGSDPGGACAVPDASVSQRAANLVSVVHMLQTPFNNARNDLNSYTLTI